MHKNYNLPDLPDAGYESLANAIILSAVSDLRLALENEGEAAREMEQKCIEFLCSDWADGLTAVDLKSITAQIVREEKRKEK